MRVANGQAPVYLGVNRFRCSSDKDAITRLETQGAMVEPTEVPGCLLALDAAAAVKSKTLRSGAVVVADLASQLVAQLARPRVAGDFLEVGAGRGTKTVLLQSAAKAELGEPVNMYSVDNRAFKTEVLRERMQELKVPGVTAVTADATKLSEAQGLPQSFDGVFLDAPCSGLGTLRRHPEERWRVTEDDVAWLSDLQYDLLCEVARACKPGARLVYATCTVLREENEYVVADFLESEAGKDFEVVPVGPELPEALRSWETPEGYLRTRTSEGGPDAHFAAVLRRKG
jgi:16S rRNA (cytosine967-C5)-methyltransferase